MAMAMVRSHFLACIHAGYIEWKANCMRTICSKQRSGKSKVILIGVHMCRTKMRPSGRPHAQIAAHGMTEMAQTDSLACAFSGIHKDGGSAVLHHGLSNIPPKEGQAATYIKGTRFDRGCKGTI
eukprot:1158743-Pelagomonas_calceolata.AAC.19